MFDYSTEEIKNDIVSYLADGTEKDCFLPSFAPRLKQELSEDFKALSELSQAPDYKVLAVYLEDYIDFKKSGSAEASFKKTDFYSLCHKTFGSEFKKILYDADVITPDNNIEFLQHNDKAAGRCYHTKDNKNTVIFIKLDNQNPLLTAKVTYHEFGHALHNRFNFFGDNGIYQTINRFSKQLQNTPDDSGLKSALCQLHSYKSMLHECFANSFAISSLLVKTKADPSVTRRLLNQSAASFVSIMEKSDNNPAYCDFPIVLKLSDKITQDFASNNTAFYFNKDGRINFKNIALLSASAVKAMAYDKSEYFDFSDFSWMNEADQKETADNPEFQFYNDYLQAKKYLYEHKAPHNTKNALSSLWLQIKSHPLSQAPKLLNSYEQYGISEDINEIRDKIKSKRSNSNLMPTLSPQQLALLNTANQK